MSAIVENQSPKTLDLKTLQEALGLAKQGLSEQEKKLVKLQTKVDAGRVEVSLLSQLVELHSGNGKVHNSAELNLQSDQGAVGRGFLLNRVEELLSEGSTPIPVGEIMERLGSDRALLPGAKEQANLISVLRTDDRFVRTQRGIYGLREWGFDEYEPPSARKKKKQRK